MPLTRDLMTTARRGPARATVTLTAAAALAVTLVSAGPPAGAQAAPAQSGRPARLATAAAAHTTQSRGPLGHRGVPGPRGLGARPQGSGVRPRASAAKLRPPRHRGTLRITGSLRDGETMRA